MKNNLTVFNFEKNEVRTLTVKGEPYFVAADVAKALGYEKARNAIAQHVDKEDALKQGILTNGGKQNATVINESGVYALIFGSKLESAKRFKHWVTSEVLPTIRKTGSFNAKEYMRTDEYKARMLKVKEANAKSRQAEKLLKVSERCGVETYKQVIYSHITLMLTGQELLPLPKAEKSTYTAAQIGEMLGITANAVGRLANANGLKTEEYGEMVWDK